MPQCTLSSSLKKKSQNEPKSKNFKVYNLGAVGLEIIRNTRKLQVLFSVGSVANDVYIG